MMASAPAMRRLKRGNNSRLHGSKNWGAAFLLMEYLSQHPLPPNRSVLDVGCGWGLAGLYCRKRFHSAVTASDADPAVFPYLQAQADINDLTIDTEVWRFADVPDDALAAADTLIASDICFWDDMAEEVYQLIARAVEAGCGRILIADPGRPPFLAVAEACIEDFYAELVPVRAHTSRPHRGYVLRIENA
jgi:predicted nicotinamide N-methyase|tara:strand:- start:455 stop:1024 length:570 start_codon:yes stop_codon:yes gene_type:complete